jgi:hypothetical protein
MARSSRYWKFFNKEWFSNNQKKLLWWINGPLSYIVRCFLEINTKEKLEEIGPNFYCIDKNSSQKCSRFYSGDVFSKNVYRILFPLWWFFHFLDYLFVDRFFPKYSFGFSSLLDVYPAAGSGGGSCDGRMHIFAGPTWSSIHDATSCDNTYLTATSDYLWYVHSGINNNQWDTMDRGFFTFNTSSITSSAVISSASLYIYGFSTQVCQFTDKSGFSIDVVSFTPADVDSVANEDYDQCGTVSFSNMAWGDYVAGSYNVFVLNSSGIANINKTGVSCFATRAYCDRVNTAPTWESSKYGYSKAGRADNSTLGFRPYLEVTYDLITPSTNGNIIIV